MRYSASHKLETRQKLLESSSVSAKQEGFATVGAVSYTHLTLPTKRIV